MPIGHELVKNEKRMDTNGIRFWELTIKTGILKREKKLISTPLDWDAPKIKKIMLRIKNRNYLLYNDK